MTTDTMKAAVATGFGEIQMNVFIREDAPSLPTEAPDKYMVIRVLSCSLAPGDLRLLSGKTSYVQLSPGGHPYVIGSDVCGVVVEGGDTSKFRKGDLVVSHLDEPIPVGGVAEYRLVKMELSEKEPTSITPVEACTLPASAMAAKVLATKFAQPNSRVLTFGGSGGSCVNMSTYKVLRTWQPHPLNPNYAQRLVAISSRRLSRGKLVGDD